jgi:galactokinase
MTLLNHEDAFDHFVRTFGGQPTHTGEATGRVNLIGEHTDYNGGWVLPTAIPQRTRVLLRQRNDNRVLVTSRTLDFEMHDYVLGEEKKTGSWRDYVQGVTKLLRLEGYKLTGFDAWIESDVPIGSGLSSSAALEVALLRALRQANALELSDMSAAKLCQAVENTFVGARVGIMDPVAVSLADTRTAILLDTDRLEYERIPIPVEVMDLIVLSSGISHRNVGGGYNTRRSECEEACRRLGVKSLRELRPQDWERAMALPEPLNRRVRHVLTENERVHAAASALQKRDLVTLGRLFNESHASMRDDYQVSIPEIDQLVSLAQSDPEVFGARLTGGGFGGSIVAACHHAAGSAVAARVAERYAKLGHTPTILVPPPLA